jgi:hypothetical protein
MRPWMTLYGIERQDWQRGCESSICESRITPVTSLTLLYACCPAPLPGPKLIPRSTAVYAVRATVFHGVPGFTCPTPAKRLHCTIHKIFASFIHELISSFR